MKVFVAIFIGLFCFNIGAFEYTGEVGDGTEYVRPTEGTGAYASATWNGTEWELTNPILGGSELGNWGEPYDEHDIYWVDGNRSSGYLTEIWWVTATGEIGFTDEGWSRVPKADRSRIFRTEAEAGAMTQAFEQYKTDLASQVVEPPKEGEINTETGLVRLGINAKESDGKQNSTSIELPLDELGVGFENLDKLKEDLATLEQYLDDNCAEKDWHDNQGGKYCGQGDPWKIINNMELPGFTANGRGMWTNKNGEKIVGEFKDDAPNGLGMYVYSSGSIYYGELDWGARHGNGVMYLSDGTVQKGEFKDNNFQQVFTQAELDKRKSPWPVTFECNSNSFNITGIFIGMDLPNNKVYTQSIDSFKSLLGRGIQERPDFEVYNGPYVDDNKVVWRGNVYGNPVINNRKGGRRLTLNRTTIRLLGATTGQYVGYDIKCYLLDPKDLSYQELNNWLDENWKDIADSRDEKLKKRAF